MVDVRRGLYHAFEQHCILSDSPDLHWLQYILIKLYRSPANEIKIECELNGIEWREKSRTKGS
jgi:hypothetical protein